MLLQSSVFKPLPDTLAEIAFLTTETRRFQLNLNSVATFA